MGYWGAFVFGLLCGILGMLGTPKSREQMREHAMALRDAYLKGVAAGRKERDEEHGRFTEALNTPARKPYLVRR